MRAIGGAAVVTQINRDPSIGEDEIFADSDPDRWRELFVGRKALTDAFGRSIVREINAIALVTGNTVARNEAVGRVEVHEDAVPAVARPANPLSASADEVV